MKRLPGASDVDRALAGALREVAKCLSSVNRQAGQLIGRGSYDDAETLMKAGRAIDNFQLRLDSLKREWRSIRVLPDEGGETGEEVPLWRTYAPILRALVSIGGSASRGELVEFLSSSDPPTSGDSHSPTASDWKRVLGRAKRPLVAEGFLEANVSIWRITDAGRGAAGDEG